MLWDFQGKKVLVSGATRGIGRAIAEKLVHAGADLAFCARNNEQVRHMEEGLAGTGKKIFGQSVDVADRSALRQWITQAGKQLDGIDILVTNPSCLSMGNAEQDWQQVFDVDLMGMVIAVDAAMPFLQQAGSERNGGVIVAIASAAAAEADYDSAYGALKAALIHYIKGVARRVAGENIRANTVSPGTVFIKDGFWDYMKQNMPQVYQSYFDRNPMGRMADAQEIAEVVAFLASPAASFTTGSNIVVDGGLTNRVNF